AGRAAVLLAARRLRGAEPSARAPPRALPVPARRWRALGRGRELERHAGGRARPPPRQGVLRARTAPQPRGGAGAGRCAAGVRGPAAAWHLLRAGAEGG